MNRLFSCLIVVLALGISQVSAAFAAADVTNYSGEDHFETTAGCTFTVQDAKYSGNSVETPSGKAKATNHVSTSVDVWDVCGVEPTLLWHFEAFTPIQALHYEDGVLEDVHFTAFSADGLGFAQHITYVMIDGQIRAYRMCSTTPDGQVCGELPH